MIDRAESLVVRQTVDVRVPPERAFEVFTRDIGTWWPLESYTLGALPAVTAVIEPRSGGRWFERAANGDRKSVV